MTHRGEEAGTLAPDLRGQQRLAHFFLQPQTVDTGGEAGDEGFEQLTIRGREVFGGTR